ncbi:hypothetical protein Q669_19140 [Labrenzia sp. C1B10]|nr:hypothetical protein Q669_19140 [Labrenzia sp. C1B10]ERP99927.1 hypothetical protein Q675_10215 [Labrenzia sp. C1B70]
MLEKISFWLFNQSQLNSQKLNKQDLEHENGQ